MENYKEGHGVLVRRTAFAVLAGVVVWGAMSLYDGLVGVSKTIKDAVLVDYVIPVLRQKLDLAFFVCWALAGVAIWRLLKMLGREKAVDFLIETDVEFRKVTWPAWGDAVTSALVVLVFVVVMTSYIALCDFSLGKLLGFML